MADCKVVLFNFWGVAVSSQPDAVFHKLEELHKLPRGFLCSVASKADGAMMRAERGQVTLSQMIPVMEEECVKEAQVRGVTLPPDWSVKTLMEALGAAMMDVQPAVLRTAACLHRSGLLTAVLVNHWLDDSAAGDGPAHLLSLLGGHFDLVLQSCRSGHRVPEPAMFSSALQQLGVTSQQAVWLDADEEGVKAAEAAGMKAVLVQSLDAALDKLATFTGVQAVRAEACAPCCSPEDVSHGYVTIRVNRSSKPHVQTHYVEMGSGPPVLLCHGFPESWYSWRHQIPALAAAGFRVLALDMKGYGESTAPPDIEEYSQEQLCKDLITFLDKLSIPQVTLVGHDWGGALVWNMAQYFPERVRAVASLNTPLFPVCTGDAVSSSGAAAVHQHRRGLCSRSEEDFLLSITQMNQSAQSHQLVRDQRGGLFTGLPEQIPMSSIMTEADLQYYVSRYKKNGFRRPLNWYRNDNVNWRWMCSRPTAKLLMPALMVTAGKDPVLLPVMSKGMEDKIPNLSRGHIEECGHWTQMDRPTETNDILIKWLKETHRKMGGGGGTPRL
ncbi:hypothetical protein INR49_001135 [Caranx melampygus]|nr:hypothetical protein INR49_001135 [Caranx melampygus]